MLLSMAQLVLVAGRGSISQQIVSFAHSARNCDSRAKVAAQAPTNPVLSEMEFFNGTGGFADEGREYVTVLRDGDDDACAVDQRHRQSGLRVSGVCGRIGPYLVRKQPRKPDHAVVK